MRRAFMTAVTVLALVAPAAGTASSFQIVVHPSVKGGHVPRAVLAQIFLKEAARWGDGATVFPVDQSFRAPVRQAFSQEVMKQPTEGVKAYWLRRIASGKGLPPPVKSSDAEVLAFVAGMPGAIGYVSVGATIPPNVKVLAVTD